MPVPLRVYTIEDAHQRATLDAAAAPMMLSPDDGASADGTLSATRSTIGQTLTQPCRNGVSRPLDSATIAGPLVTRARQRGDPAGVGQAVDSTRSGLLALSRCSTNRRWLASQQNGCNSEYSEARSSRSSSRRRGTSSQSCPVPSATWARSLQRVRRLHGRQRQRRQRRPARQTRGEKAPGSAVAYEEWRPAVSRARAT